VAALPSPVDAGGLGERVVQLDAVVFVPQDQPLAPWRRPAVLAGGDLAVRAAHAESEAVYE